MDEESKNQEKTAEPTADVDSAPEQSPAPKKKPVLLITAIVLLIVTGGGLIAWMLSQETDNSRTEVAEQADDVVGQTVFSKNDLVDLSYPIVDTNQNDCYNNTERTDCPNPSLANQFNGQDGSYQDPYKQPAYTDNKDGTITDDVTGLMWQKDPGQKQSYQQASQGAKSLELGGYDDWRVPTIKELYSLMDFSGIDPDPMGSSTSGLSPFIDDSVFDFEYGDTADGSRIIDSQWVTSSVYKSSVMGGEECFFGVNFADGRIKCYPTSSQRNAGYFIRYVRGNTYGINDLVDNGDKTIADNATGLLWQQEDSGKGMEWSEALEYCQDLTLAGNDSWYLPNAKELQSIVDYSRSPDTSSSPALDPVFNSTEIENEAGQRDWPSYWTSTTHIGTRNASAGIYVSFGRALGNMPQFGGWVDVHGAGSQRSDPKSGDPSEFSQGRGPQGDAVRILNHVRCAADSIANLPRI
ncbi:MAG: DUF1566 domain-containing protein [Candidatus Saccharimonadales bacterium]|nr:DUF1566 domain-containing protein [Candidatus Saccharimonadales bacterium]